MIKRTKGRVDIAVLDQYNLEDEVRRVASKMSLSDAWREINTHYLPSDCPPISIQAFYYYCQKRGIVSARPTSQNVKSSFDPLLEAQSVRSRVIRHTRKLSKFIDELKKEERLSEVATISNAYLNSCKQLASLNESISKIRKEQLASEKVRLVLKALLEVLSNYPDVKTEFMEKIRELELYDTIRYL